jgi:hypothetical protein
MLFRSLVIDRFVLVVLIAAAGCDADARPVGTPPSGAKAPAPAQRTAVDSPASALATTRPRQQADSGRRAIAAPARRVDSPSEAEQRAADAIVFAPRPTARFVVAARNKRLLLDVGRLDADVKGDAELLALVRRIAARSGPLAGVRRVRVHGTWGAESDSIAGWDVWNGRVVAVLHVEPRTDSLLRRGAPLVGIAERAPLDSAPSPPEPAAAPRQPASSAAAGAPAPAPCVRDSLPEPLRQRVASVRDSLVRWMTDSLRSPFPRIARATVVRGDAAFGCFAAWRAVVVATSRNPSLEGSEERALLVGADGKVASARLRDLRLRAHELPVAFDADDDGIDELAVRGLAPRMGAQSVLRLDPASRRFARIASGFAWESRE